MTWLSRLVRLAALSLPRALRDRYREEWLADVEGARAAGIRASGIVVGAILFSVTLDRGAPEIAGVPLSVTAARRARWGIALLSSAAVLAIGMWINGTGAQDPRSLHSAAEIAVAVTATLFPYLTIGLVAAGLLSLWSAAAITSMLAKITAALATAGVGAVVAAVWDGRFDGILLLVAAALFMSAAICGLVTWTAAPTAASGAVRSPSIGRRSRWHRLAIVSMVLGVIAAVTVGALDLLVLSPLWMAPGYALDQIYSALSEADLTSGLVMIYIWIGFWGLAALVYLAVALVTIRRPSPSTRLLVLAGIGLVTTMVFMQFWAGFSIGNSISDTLPPMQGGRSEVGVLYGAIGQLALVAVIVGLIAPRRLRAVRAALA